MYFLLGLKELRQESPLYNVFSRFKIQPVVPGTVLSALDIFTYLIFIRSQEVCVIILITHFPDEREAQKLSKLPKIT